MLKRGTLVLSLFATALGAAPAFAAEDTTLSTTIHHLYQSNRALGMGDAFVAVANDYSAIFYNPAGLARRDDGQVNLSINIGGSPGTYTFYKDMDAIQKSDDSELQKQTDIAQLIQDNYGKTFSFRLAPLEGIWVRPKWGVAFIPADVSMEMTMHQQVGPTADTIIYADSTLALSYADDLHWIEHSRLSWGVTGKFVNRGYLNKQLRSSDFAANSKIIDKEDLLEGYTVDADLGTLWTPEMPDVGLWSFMRMARPTFGLVVRNIAETGFGQTMKLLNKDKTEAPEKLYRVVDVGSRWEYPSAWIFGGRGTLDVRDIGHPNFNWRKGVHAGLEFDWAVSSWWKGHYRGGLSQGYWTAGVSLELGIFNLDVVSYADDVGTLNSPKENRNYAVKLNLDF
jgi:hypothetical protein